MHSISYSIRANNDLEHIYNFSQNGWGVYQADGYLSGILDVIASIELFPEIGMERNTRAGEFRQIRVQSHHIFYRIISSEEIRILRVVHVHRLLRDDDLLEIE